MVLVVVMVTKNLVFFWSQLSAGDPCSLSKIGRVKVV